MAENPIRRTTGKGGNYRKTKKIRAKKERYGKR